MIKNPRIGVRLDEFELREVRHIQVLASRAEICYDVHNSAQERLSMPASTTMTIRVSLKVKEKLNRIAIDTRRSKSFLAGEAVAAYAERELEIIEGIKRSQADATAGRVVPHDEVIAEMREVIEDAKRRKAARG